ncbi:surfactin synthase thioesterase subunit [Kitasatospora sp. MAA4]|uniref:thioesterase II family protein n=1 Tax=Kitasatospora sp. MAA4 TaxID=3035093 RepID=UPI00247420C6|nr:alpha/beta fold hydrolase [Kitasatospora sp. MAA4]MDH6134295.1 surfactin synthase thioesterase subunit [Kitasatospora sp. MAA4]
MPQTIPNFLDSMGELTVQASEEWIQNFRPAPEAGVRLVCCPHAGASASAFGPLARALPAWIEALSVQYPGRQAGSAGFTDIGELAERTAEKLAPWADRPLAVFGHSMGSAVAFELVRRLQAAGTPPVRLFVSGRRAPSDGLGANVPRNDEEIVEELRALGGVPVRLLERPKYREAVLSVIRNDYRANSGYLASPQAVVDCPVTFLLAAEDPYVDRDAAGGWQRHTSRDFSVLPFPGGHFYLNDQLEKVAGTIAADLRGHASRPALGGHR